MSLILAYLPHLLEGLLVTLEVAFGSFAIGLVIAVAAVFGAEFGNAPVRWCVSTYVTVIRGLPELLVIFLVFYGGTVLLSRIFGAYVEVDALSAGICALSFVSGAYLTEILRGALHTIPPGQAEAAKSLGLGAGATFRHVILPQMFAYALPGLGNQWLIILKESALVSIVGLEELMRKGVVAAGATQSPMTFYLIVAGLYVAITSVSMAIFAYGNRRLTVGR
ncbi:ABC transporter permease subunit [Shinella sp. 838]|jgi:His/Glu/Gln/Arg/opine family amino acid ABC transporter permease subunit|uniref:ABC transporter permease n=2 Tax=Shinella TaxID=323620 RepID=UPI0003C52EC4|nr:MULTISPECIES: ABC transporter permease subunit [unclassified Shinella]EYR83910.1 amine acid ABC transporter, permease protein His/Glu/Gln/Arg/opine family [Shinella sp. DD12]MDG4675021.1 ABC transporter permease subunit [Shinella sp. 838]